MAYDLSKVVVTSSPHIKADDDTWSLMLDVLIALVPALAVAVYTFGARALIHVVIAMVASLVFETIYNKIVHHPNTVGDLSRLVTGVLIAFNIPVAAPLWLSAFGALFGIIVVKDAVRRHRQELYEPGTRCPCVHDGIPGPVS